MTQSHDNFTLIRRILRALGLSADAVDDIVDWITELLSERQEKDTQIEFPYSLRDDFLTPAEHSFLVFLVQWCCGQLKRGPIAARNSGGVRTFLVVAGF